jgi:glycosyltransferase involved in cell wall biosynthesis
LRILLDYRPALRERTGVGEYVHELAAALARQLSQGDSLTLLSASWKDRLEPDRVPRTEIRDVRVPVKLLNLAWHRVGWPPVELFAGHVDVVHAAHPLLVPSRAAAQVVTIADLDFMDHPERTRAEIRRDYAALAPAHARRAHGIVTISEYTAGEIVRRFGVERDRIAICPPGAPAWSPRAQRPARGPIFFMGTLEPRKNVGFLLKAYAALLERMPSAPDLVLAGRATPAAASWLQAIKQPPFAAHVRHVGYVQPDRRYELYATASMLVMPSHLEGFGMPVLEAMTVGVPVIVTNRGALPEVVGDAGQIVELDDVEGLARAIEGYLEDPSRVEAVVQKGFERARHYSWDASARTLRAAYAAAIAQRRAT